MQSLRQKRMSTKRKQVQTPPQIIWDCPSCDSDDASFYRVGLRAGTAKCKRCGHVWKWAKQDENANAQTKSKKIEPVQRTPLVEEEANHYPSSLFGGDTDLYDLESLRSVPTKATGSIRAQSTGPKLEEEKPLIKAQEKLEALKKLLSSTERTSSVVIKREHEEDVSTKHKKQRQNDDNDTASESLFERWPKKQLLPKRRNVKLSHDSDNEDGDDDDDEDTGYKESYIDQGESSGSDFVPDDGDESDGFNTPGEEDPGEEEEEQSKRSKKNKGKGKATAKAKSTKPSSSSKKNNDDDSDDNIFSDPEDIDWGLSEEESSTSSPHKQATEAESSQSEAQRHRYTRYKPNPASKYTPYMLFNKENRKRISDENPGLHNRLLSTKVSEVYRNLPPEEREKYEKESARLMAEVRQQRQVRRRNERMPGNGYIQYSKEVGAKIRKEHPEYSLKDANSVIGSGWKKLSAEEKQKYNDLAAKLRKEFIEKNPEFVALRKAKMVKRIKETRERKRLGKK